MVTSKSEDKEKSQPSKGIKFILLFTLHNNVLSIKNKDVSRELKEKLFFNIIDIPFIILIATFIIVVIMITKFASSNSINSLKSFFYSNLIHPYKSC